MQPFAFTPWVWRDPSALTGDYGRTADEAAGRGDSIRADEQAGANLSGYDVEATDGSIGEIDEATYEVGSACLVVDTGPWIFGRKVLLPAGTVQRVDHGERKVYVDRTKDRSRTPRNTTKTPSVRPSTASGSATTTPAATSTHHRCNPPEFTR